MKRARERKIEAQAAARYGRCLCRCTQYTKPRFCVVAAVLQLGIKNVAEIQMWHKPSIVALRCRVGFATVCPAASACMLTRGRARHEQRKRSEGCSSKPREVLSMRGAVRSCHSAIAYIVLFSNSIRYSAVLYIRSRRSIRRFARSCPHLPCTISTHTPPMSLLIFSALCPHPGLTATSAPLSLTPPRLSLHLFIPLVALG
jgi:hypothetical protein